MITIEINHFDLRQIAGSGQCFRMNCLKPGLYSAVSRGRYLEISQEGSSFIFIALMRIIRSGTITLI